MSLSHAHISPPLPTQFVLRLHSGVWCLSGVSLVDLHWLPLQVNSQLRDIVDNHSSLWARVKFGHTWPSPKTLWLFERYICSFVTPITSSWMFVSFFWMFKLTCLSRCRAAEKGNFEAAVKLGVAFLYNEGRKLKTQCCLSDFSQYFVRMNEDISVLRHHQRCWATRGGQTCAVARPRTSSAWLRACARPWWTPSSGSSSVPHGRPPAAAAKPWCSSTSRPSAKITW